MYEMSFTRCIVTNSQRFAYSQKTAALLDSSISNPAVSLAQARKVQRALIITTLNSGSDLSAIDMTGVDLTGWNCSEIDFSVSNVTGAQLNGCTNLSYANLGGLDLTGFVPAANIYMTTFSGAVNLPWATINPGYLANMSGMDLTGWSPGAGSYLFMGNFSNATNIPWAAINANSLATPYSGTIFKKTDIRGFNPASKNLMSAQLPLGARDKEGFEIATQITPTSGTVFTDGTTPWGP
jgi:uncharacterized protein YjbI with pentapeptide repeats